MIKRRERDTWEVSGHVPDEVAVARSINDCYTVSKYHSEMSMLMVLPKSLSFSQLVHDPGILEGALSQLYGK